MEVHTLSSHNETGLEVALDCFESTEMFRGEKCVDLKWHSIALKALKCSVVRSV